MGSRTNWTLYLQPDTSGQQQSPLSTSTWYWHFLLQVTITWYHAKVWQSQIRHIWLSSVWLRTSQGDLRSFLVTLQPIWIHQRRYVWPAVTSVCEKEQYHTDHRNLDVGSTQWILRTQQKSEHYCQRTTVSVFVQHQPRDLNLFVCLYLQLHSTGALPLPSQLCCRHNICQHKDVTWRNGGREGSTTTTTTSWSCDELTFSPLITRATHRQRPLWIT